MSITGVLPALVTPLYRDESLNRETLRRLMEQLLSQGATGFYIGGATGEGLSLRPEVRRELTEEAVTVAAGRVPCVVHVAATSFAEAVSLARHAEAHGADAISAIAPIFYHYGAEEVYLYYKRLAESVHIPLMVYFSPSANFSVSADFAARLFAVDNITAIKWTSSNFYEMLRLKDITHGEMNVLNGFDEMLLMGLAAGADGGIGTTYNVILPRIRGVYDAFRAGRMDDARREQAGADQIIHALLQYEIIPAVKAVLRAQGFDAGDAAFPLRRYDEREQAAIVRDAAAAGLNP